MKKILLITVVCVLLCGCSTTTKYQYKTVTEINSEMVPVWYDIKINDNNAQASKKTGSDKKEKFKFEISSDDKDLLAEVEYEKKIAERDGEQALLFIAYLDNCVADYLDAQMLGDEEKAEEYKTNICMFLGTFGTHGYSSVKGE